MAVEARHLNLFPSHQPVANREVLLNPIDSTANAYCDQLRLEECFRFQQQQRQQQLAVLTNLFFHFTILQSATATPCNKPKRGRKFHLKMTVFSLMAIFFFQA
ncbi:hypothetical protein Nepgr_001175 [Nepenthes gracilis]|uniref:Uncharacterized protein n=1 Tax=Nepenthes gracilis TaxID=150966 RepID=A0AAD3P3Y7_NEPGR|nr:hypothetical protein Nepgr_001175 [Nepenthes gracilis]